MGKMRKFLQRIDAAVGRLPLDFTLHFIVSAAVATVVMIAAGVTGCNLLQSALLALLVTLVVGVAKEVVIDTWIKGAHTDEKDLAADLCGAVSAVAAMSVAAIVF
nr:MAG TPA: putative periplasmic lipoprotein [Caudoviricetes sp.]